MAFPLRPIAFVLAASNHGTMIVNRNDHRMVEGGGYGVGHQILSKSSFDEGEVGFALALLERRRLYFGNGVVAIDGGANIGVHTIEWARHMHGWGQVIAFEAQEIVYYALAGNIVLNNCLNARARLAALGDSPGQLSVPQPNYLLPGSFGSLELRQRTNTEFIGQQISYDAAEGSVVPMVSIDSLSLARLDFVKIDVEGMEMDVLRGAQATLQRLHPILLIEVIKSDRAALEAFVTALDYRVFPMGLNMLAIHAGDPTLKHVALNDNILKLA